MDLLNAIRCFIKVVEAGSIAAGARILGLSPAAVSQNLARLESHLQVRLLSRTTRSMAMTPSGAQYYERVKHIERDLALAEQAGVDAGLLAPALAGGFADSRPLQILAPQMAIQPRIAANKTANTITVRASTPVVEIIGTNASEFTSNAILQAL